MGSLGNPRSWVPYLNNKDCSQGFCSLYCPQWCYIIYPPPPPPPHSSFARSATLSPLLVALIGVFLSAVLLVTYYAIVAKYCASAGRRTAASSPPTADESRSDYVDDEPWPRAEALAGLDEAAIATIAVLKYRAGEGGIEGTDCSVCLSEFDEGESVRLLPKCSHAFHVLCIDTWLRSHSNCPLCRAGVVAVSVTPVEAALGDGPVADAGAGDSNSGTDNGAENGADRSSRASSYLEGRHITIEVKDITRRRSVSVDFTQQSRVSLADILKTNDEEEEENEEVSIDLEECSVDRAGCSKSVDKRVNDHRKQVSRCLSSPIAMKRSISSSRFFLRKNPVIPL